MYAEKYGNEKKERGVVRALIYSRSRWVGGVKNVRHEYVHTLEKARVVRMELA